MITIEVTSDTHGEGKSTTSAIILAALQSCGYNVTLKPIAVEGHPNPRRWRHEEIETIESLALQPGPKLSHPKSTITLITHG